jgi:sulfide:quinone oxidoreductase
MASANSTPLSVVVAGGGIAGAEALLALRSLAGDRVDLTLIAPGPDLVIRPLAVATPFSRGHATRHPLSELVASVAGEWVADTMESVDPGAGQVVLGSGARLAYDALVVTVGARAVVGVERATTWWPEGDPERFGGLLRDLEEGYSRRVAFVLPAGPTWPLPAYELALMTAREVAGMGIDGAELTVVTPEKTPLALLGPEAAVALAAELESAGVALETGSVARVEDGSKATLVLEPSDRRLTVDRVVAMPRLVGPAVPGLPAEADGFVPVDGFGRVRGLDRVWAAGDGIDYPLKFGGLATQQADAAAADIAAVAGAAIKRAPLRPRLQGILMTGAAPRTLGADPEQPDSAASQPLWRGSGKVSGVYLSPYLGEPEPPAAPAGALVVEQPLPGLDEGTTGADNPLLL